MNDERIVQRLDLMNATLLRIEELLKGGISVDTEKQFKPNEHKPPGPAYMGR